MYRHFGHKQIKNINGIIDVKIGQFPRDIIVADVFADIKLVSIGFGAGLK